MKDFPVCLQLEGRPVLLVGGGFLGGQRLRTLVEVGAQVHLVAPELGDEARALVSVKGVRYSQRPFEPGDLEGAFVVFTATNVPDVNRAVVAGARAKGLLVNAADAPSLCDFTVPSVGRQGAVTIAVSTSGEAPGLSRLLRQRLMTYVGPEYATLARLLGRLRRRIPGGPVRARAIASIVEQGAAELIAKRDRRGLRAVVRAAFREEAA